MNKLLVDGIYATNIVKLKDIAEKKTTKNIDGLVTETFTNSAENGIISQSDFFDRTITNDKNISGYYIVEPDDFVYNPRISTFAPVGPINRNKLGRSGVMSPLYLVFHTHDVEPEYLEWYFKSNAWHQFMRDNGNTGARSDRFSISDAEFFNMPIPIPPVKVQKAIAKTLTTLDTKVTLEKNEVEKFQNLKSAMLTKMFPKKGGNVPKIRFDGFTDVWEQRKLGELVEFYNGDRSSRYPNDSDMVSEGVPFINAGDLILGRVKLDTANKITEEKFKELSGAKIQRGDIIYCLRGTLGKNAFVDNFDAGTVASSLVDIRPKKVVGKYLYQVLNSDIEYTQRTVNDEGAAQPNLSAKNLSLFNIPMPDEVEQEKIAAYFDDLDRLITLHQRKYEKLIDTKKAFLEKLIGGEK